MRVEQKQEVIQNIKTSSRNITKSVLLVDDDLYLCDLFRLVMEHYHWEITIFQLAEDAIAYLKSHNPDFIILDLMLPQLDGLRAYKKIHNDLPEVSSKFIATTAYYTDNTEQRILKYGFDGFLSKPFDPTKLTKFLLSLLD